MLIATLQLAGGLVVLFVGGHYLVRGAVAVALLARVSTAVVALTVVSIGTSLPELAVSLDAAARGATDISFGNIIGSNIFNVGAILGLAAILAPIPVLRQTLRIEYPIMFAVSCVAVLLAANGLVGRLEGGLLLGGLVAFIAYAVWLARHPRTGDDPHTPAREIERNTHVQSGTARAWGVNVALVAAGMGALVVGADLAVRGAVAAANLLHVPERVIGLTVIAMGTSLPELATSLIAARRGEQEIALGNVVGSNIFNLLGILGATAAIFPVPVNPRAESLDNWVMLAFSAALLPLMLERRAVTRWNGMLLLGGFVVYMTFVVVTR